MRKIAGALVAVLPLVAVALPASAGAWSASNVFEFSVVAAPGETNTLTVNVSDGTARDTTAPRGPLGGNCAPVGADSVKCSGAVDRGFVDLGDGDDTLDLSGDGMGGEYNRVYLGTGRDTVLSGGPSSIYAVDHERDTIHCTGSGPVYADAIDVLIDCPNPVIADPIAVTAQVTTTADTFDGVCDASCSLRDAVETTRRAGAGTVLVPAGVYELGSQLLLDRGITVRGAGARATILRGSGGATYPIDQAVVEVKAPYYGPGSVSATLSGLGVVRTACRNPCFDGVVNVDGIDPALSASGLAVSGPGIGIKSQGRRPITVADSTVVSPSAAGIEAGQATVINSTIIAENPLHVGTATATHATLVGPLRASDFPAGNPAITLRASILAGTCGVPITSAGANVLDPSCTPGGGDALGDAGLGALANNGGPTDTLLPAEAGLARDRNPACTDADGVKVAADQRGVARPFGAGCDSGAVEWTPPPPPSPPSTGRPAPVDRVRPALRSLKPSVRRGSAAKLRKLALRFSLSEPARVTVTLRGRSVKAQTAAGTHRIAVGKLFRRSLRRGRYVLKITATDAAGNVSRTYRLTLRLK